MLRRALGEALWIMDELLDRIPSWSPRYGWQRYGDYGCRMNLFKFWEPLINARAHRPSRLHDDE